MGNIMKASIEDIKTYRLILDIGCHITNNVFYLFKDMYCYRSSTLIDCLYCFNLDAKVMDSLFNIECFVDIKCNVHDNNFAYLWHQRLVTYRKKE
ncbi:hypothetical protein CR513_40825, partial [Mucuna pruriens]